MHALPEASACPDPPLTVHLRTAASFFQSACCRQVRCFEMLEVLGNPQVQREMLEWAGWRRDNLVVNTSIVLNKGVDTIKQVDTSSCTAGTTN
eukprot:SAG11_NODE_3520_length_2396_cov_1.235960_3_plen_93_part_00